MSFFVFFVSWTTQNLEGDNYEVKTIVYVVKGAKECWSSEWESLICSPRRAGEAGAYVH